MTAKLKCFFCCVDKHVLEFLARICLGFAWVNQHLYRTKTSSLQIISGLSLIFFGLAFGVGGAELYKLRTYQHFQMLQPWLLMLILVAIFLSCLCGSEPKRLRQSLPTCFSKLPVRQ